MIYIHEKIVDFPCHRTLWSLRTFVNINLCATLFIAQLIFVVGIDQTSNEASHHQLCVREFDASYVVLCTCRLVVPLLPYCSTISSSLHSCGC